MPDLIAQGAAPEHRWRRSIPPDHTCILGRAAGFWSTPWDDRISRRHAEFSWHDDSLQVVRIPSSRNPIFVRGEQEEQFIVRPGEHFVIGSTTFTLADERVNVTLDAPQPVSEQTFSARYLKDVRFRNADQRIDVLSRIPDIISGATSDEEMFVRLVSVLLTGIPHAVAAALVAARDESDLPSVSVLHWDRRLLAEEEFCPSEPLIRQALSTQESIVHVWTEAWQQDSTSPLEGDEDWAFCTPVPGRTCRGWAIYVSGRFPEGGTPSPRPNSRDLQDDLKFTELVATTVSNLREVGVLERTQTSLRQFLSPVVLRALSGHDPDEVLAPREADVSVLFCDLRGFSQRSERDSDDLMGLLNRVSDALGIMTRHILNQGGVVGDFHGDAAMGFWGWPLVQKDSIACVCRAALDIRSEFVQLANRTDHPLSDFRIGIGIATGRAVAGKIGTVDQVKVSVFGPVVNLASRLEGMTKILRAPILLDEATALAVRSTVSSREARVRRVAIVKPYGVATPLEVSELLPPESDYADVRDADIAAYEQALDALLEGDWQLAFRQLHKVTAQDRVKDFLTVFIAQHDRTPPAGWDGVIPLSSKH